MSVVSFINLELMKVPVKSSSTFQELGLRPVPVTHVINYKTVIEINVIKVKNTSWVFLILVCF